MNSAKIFIIVLATLTVVSSAQVPSNDFAADHQGHNAEFQHDPDISIKEDNADFFKEDKEIQLPIYDTDRNDIEGDSLDVQLKELENVKKFDPDFGGAYETREGAEEIEWCCPDGWIGYNKKCYRTFHSPKDWISARNYCRDTGGELATIDSMEHNTFIAKHVSGRTLAPSVILWIGLNDQDCDGIFKWVANGESLGFQAWAPDHPWDNLLFRNCVFLTYEDNSIVWKDWPCKKAFGFVCQKD